MKKGALIILITASLLTAAAREAHCAPGWDEAVSIFETYSGLRPHRMEIISKTFDGRGNLEKTEQQVLSLDYGPDGEIAGSRLIKAVEDGRDITEEKRKSFRFGPPEGHGGGRNSDGMDKHPLDPAVQNDVIAAWSGRSEYKNGRSCKVWDFEIKLNSKYTGIGTAWLAAESGEAVSIEYYIDPLFPFVEAMNIGMDFKNDPGGRWLMDRMRMNGRVNMIIMKKTFDAVTIFSDYR